MALTRKVRWAKECKRDDLPVRAKNTLGSTLTIFSIPDEVYDALINKKDHQAIKTKTEPSEVVELNVIKEETIERSRELIKDKICKLTDRELPLLFKSILSAMGFKCKVSPPGPDRGADIIASPDGLGLQNPRIKVEVKHRQNEKIGAPLLRSFIGTLREGDRGIYLSTGWYAKDAKYEAERSVHSVSLIDLDDLVDLVCEHYEKFDHDGVALLPLVKIYWPQEIDG
jgi:restriction system protein